MRERISSATRMAPGRGLCKPFNQWTTPLTGLADTLRLLWRDKRHQYPEMLTSPQGLRRHAMAMTLLGISGSLTKGGSTRTAIDCALRAAQQHYPEITTAVLDLRDATLAFCDGRARPWLS